VHSTIPDKYKSWVHFPHLFFLQFTENATLYSFLYTFCSKRSPLYLSKASTLPEPLSDPNLIQLPENISGYATLFWGIPKYPYLPFIAKSPTFRQYPLNRLAIEVETTPLDCHPTKGWRFPEKHSSSWLSLQSSLLILGTTLLSWFEDRYPERPLPAILPPLPDTFGFTRFHQTAQEARKCLSLALESFIVLIGYVSYAIAISSPDDDVPSMPNALWVRHMLKTKKLHPSWYDGIRDSFITDFSSTLPHVGMICHVSYCPPEHLVQRLISCHIPVWFYWGLPPLLSTNHTLATRYRPLLENQSGSSLSNTQHVLQERKPFKVEPNSQQKPGESISFAGRFGPIKKRQESLLMSDPIDSTVSEPK